MSKIWQQRERALELLSKEVGYVRKPHGGRLRVALAFPNTYFVGMSNLGFQTVYKLFNAEDDIVCERVFLPPKTELAAQLAVRRAARHARVADAGPRVRHLRVLGLVRVGLHERADAAAARRHSSRAPRERTHRDPLVMIGGAVTFVNPEPLALFADIIAAGEGEALIPSLLSAFAAATRSRRSAAPARRGARVLRAVLLRRAVRGETGRSRRSCRATAPVRRRSSRRRR